MIIKHILEYPIFISTGILMHIRLRTHITFIACQEPSEKSLLDENKSVVKDFLAITSRPLSRPHVHAAFQINMLRLLSE